MLYKHRVEGAHDRGLELQDTALDPQEGFLIHIIRMSGRSQSLGASFFHCASDRNG